MDKNYITKGKLISLFQRVQLIIFSRHTLREKKDESQKYNTDLILFTYRSQLKEGSGQNMKEMVSKIAKSDRFMARHMGKL